MTPQDPQPMAYYEYVPHSLKLPWLLMVAPNGDRRVFRLTAGAPTPVLVERDWKTWRLHVGDEATLVVEPGGKIDGWFTSAAWKYAA